MGQILKGDSLEELKKLDTSSIDFIFGMENGKLRKLNKGWNSPSAAAGSYDNSLTGRQSFQQFIHEISLECLRVLKPGAFMCMTMSPRQDVLSRCMIAIEDAGFNMGFTSMYWTFASGFPKAGNIGKLVDKRLGNEREALPPKQFADGTTQRQTARAGIYSEQKGQAQNTKGNSELEGSYAGFQPKPAVEVIIVAMKPLSEKTYVDQALANSKGISWLDDCRIPTGEPVQKQTGHKGQPFGEREHPFTPREYSTQGRFPANLLVSDDVLNDGVVSKSGSGNKHPKASSTFMASTNYQDYAGTAIGGDSGSHSRYFDLDKWASTLPFLIVPKASKGEKNKGLEHILEKQMGKHQSSLDGGKMLTGSGNERSNAKKNHHPTVKPLKLMSYLITLFSREGDTVLDPFAGSGTTCVAAKELKRSYIGIELETDYVEISEARLAAVKEPEPRLL